MKKVLIILIPIIILLIAGLVIAAYLFWPPQDMYIEGDSITTYQYCKCRGLKRLDKTTGRAINFSGICYGKLYDCQTYQHDIRWE